MLVQRPVQNLEVRMGSSKYCYRTTFSGNVGRMHEIHEPYNCPTSIRASGTGWKHIVPNLHTRRDSERGWEILVTRTHMQRIGRQVSTKFQLQMRWEPGSHETVNTYQEVICRRVGRREQLNALFLATNQCSSPASSVDRRDV